ncbi:MAG: hypothetical protein ACI4J2_12490 [Ruminococcus sp.]
MTMRGIEIHSINDLLKNFSIDELIYYYYSGELELFLREINENEKADYVNDIKKNSLLLIRLYHIFNLELEMTEEMVRQL